MPGLMQSRFSNDFNGHLGPHSLIEQVPTLAEILCKQGFSCAGWHSNHFTSREFSYQRGFEIFADLKYDSSKRTVDDSDNSSGLDLTRSLISHGRCLSRQFGIEAQAKRALEWFQTNGMLNQPSVSASSIVDAILDRISVANSDTALFLWGHLMDTHSPYSPPEQYRKGISKEDIQTLNQKIRRQPHKITSSERDVLKNLYIGSAKYVDDQISRMITHIKSAGLWDETLLIVTSDHGEMFSERSIPDYYPFEHPSYLCDYVTHVPLVLASGALSNKTINKTISGIDIAPTIAAIAGAEIPDMWHGIPIESSKQDKRKHVYSVTGPGSRLTQKNEGFPDSVMHASLRTECQTVLWWSDEQRSAEFYDRTKTHLDPTAHEMTISDNKLINNCFIDIIESRFSEDECHTRNITDHAEKLDEETTNRLQNLGYIE
jgi:arylsulfatase A-like enzyme